MSFQELSRTLRSARELSGALVSSQQLSLGSFQKLDELSEALRSSQEIASTLASRLACIFPHRSQTKTPIRLPTAISNVV